MRRLLAIVLALSAFTLCGAIGLSQPEGRELIVTLKDNQSIGRVNRDHNTTMLRQFPGTSVYLVRTDDDVDRTLKELRKDRGVDYAEANTKIRLNGTATPGAVSGLSTETMYLLDGRTTTNFYGSEVLQIYASQPALSLIQADRVREISTGTGTRVAYIDTGVDFQHPALAAWLDPGVDLVNGGSASELDGLSTETMYLLDTDTMYLLDTDTMYLLDHRFTFLLNSSLSSVLAGPGGAGFPPAFGHGTLVAGVIHAVAPTARIVPIKAFDAYGYTTLARIVEGVYQAIAMNVDVLNMSFSTSQNSQTLWRAVTAAHSHGIAVVASAGNEARQMSDAFPAAFPGVYGVAASDFNDRLASYSSYGALVSLTAPGSYVISTVPGGRYAAAWGTSFSAPLVSGAMALRSAVLGHGHSEGPIVVSSTDSIDAINPGFERQLGTGRLNARQALER